MIHSMPTQIEIGNQQQEKEEKEEEEEEQRRQQQQQQQQQQQEQQTVPTHHPSHLLVLSLFLQALACVFHMTCVGRLGIMKATW